MIKVVLFDLDGTLLPMDLDVFTKGYFKKLAKKMLPLGYEPNKLVDSIWAGTAKMVQNDGSITNEEAFWKEFVRIYGEDALKDRKTVEDFYREDFKTAKEYCGYNPLAKQTVELAKSLGYRVALATNPIFPREATATRVSWCDLQLEDFELYTSYENISYCKPNPEYYREILKRLDVDGTQCLMVGNDVDEDMITEKLGMSVFLLTDCLINKHGKDISSYPQGNFVDLMEHLRCLSNNKATEK